MDKLQTAFANEFTSRRLTLIGRAGAGYDEVDMSSCTANQVAVAIAAEA